MSHTAKTPVYGVIGDPVAHSLSPVIQHAIARAAGDDIVYTAFRVKPDEVADAIRGAYTLGIQGLNVTIPHKKSVIPYLSRVDEAAREAGAVNTLLYTPDGYHGYNTDITGIARTLRAADVPLAGCTGIVLGGGGSAPAAVLALVQNGARRVYIVNRTLERAQMLAAGIGGLYPADVTAIPQGEMDSLPHAEVLIQTTSAGFGKQAGITPVANPRFFERVGMVLDIIYTPWETQLLRDARACGSKCVNGFDMLVYQAMASYEIWRGKRLTDEAAARVLRELREFAGAAI